MTWVPSHFEVKISTACPSRIVLDSLLKNFRPRVFVLNKSAMMSAFNDLEAIDFLCSGLGQLLKAVVPGRLLHKYKRPQYGKCVTCCSRYEPQAPEDLHDRVA